MKASLILSGLATLNGALAAESLCNKYTGALFGSNTAANQQALLTKVVNTAVIGNYTPGAKNAVAGILAPGVYNGMKVNLLPYFDGALDSSNRGGQCGVSVNFLDGGGAAPLMKDLPADCTDCNQYFLLTHLYEFFAALLGCSIYGNTVSPYAGFNGMYQVHKFMALDNAEVGWFIEQVGLAATSLGVTSTDAEAVGTALMNAFGYRCEAPASIPSFEPAELQSICIDCDCPQASPADCSAYAPVVHPRPSGTSQEWCGTKDWQGCQESCQGSWEGHW